MPTVRDIISVLETIAPRRFALGFDKVGLQVGDLCASVNRAVVSLDRSIGAVEFAKDQEAQMLISHHPLIFQPIASVDSRSHEGRTILKLIQNGIAFAAAHTNWDAAKGGINDTLADLFDLVDARPFGMVADVRQLQFFFYCPVDRVEAIIDAVSEAGAGKIGDYRRCAFRLAGHGSFIGSKDSHPAIGVPGEPVLVDEVRVEMTVPDERRGAIARALVRSHPYEEPVFGFSMLAPTPEQPLGRIGSLREATTLADFSARADQMLDTRSWTWGDPNRRIRKVAVVGGAADTEWIAAQKFDADVLLTGEVKQHVAVEATESGMCLIASGHYATENPGCIALAERLKTAVPEVQWLTFTPPSGRFGRPL